MLFRSGEYMAKQKKNGISGAAGTISVIIAVVCILVYAGSLVYAGVRFINNYKERRAVAERELDKLTVLVSSIGFLGFMSPNYQSEIQSALLNSASLEGIIITGSNGAFSFEREEGKSVIQNTDPPRFKSGFGVSADLPYMPLQIEGQRNGTLRAAYSTIDYSDFIDILRQTFTAVLGSFCLAFVTLILLIFFGKNQNAARQPDESELEDENGQSDDIDEFFKTEDSKKAAPTAGFEDVSTEDLPDINISGAEGSADEDDFDIPESDESSPDEDLPDVDFSIPEPDESPGDESNSSFKNGSGFDNSSDIFDDFESEAGLNKERNNFAPDDETLEETVPDFSEEAGTGGQEDNPDGESEIPDLDFSVDESGESPEEGGEVPPEESGEETEPENDELPEFDLNEEESADTGNEEDAGLADESAPEEKAGESAPVHKGL
jgi:hypothetical protein